MSNRFVYVDWGYQETVLLAFERTGYALKVLHRKVLTGERGLPNIGDAAVELCYRYKAIPYVITDGPGQTLLDLIQHDLGCFNPKPEPKADVVGFIAANGNEDKFRAWGQLGPIWVTEKKKACVMLRREDCEAVFAEDEDTWKILPVTAADLQ